MNDAVGVRYIPIIASVSEHQPTTWTSFFFDLNILVPLSPVGLWVLYKRPTDGAIFVIIYGTLSWYFAGVMVRLMLTLAPIACILAAVGMSALLQRFVASLRFGGGGSRAGKGSSSGARTGGCGFRKRVSPFHLFLPLPLFLTS